MGHKCIRRRILAKMALQIGLVIPSQKRQTEKSVEKCNQYDLRTATLSLWHLNNLRLLSLGKRWLREDIKEVYRIMHGVEKMETLKRKAPFMSRFNSKFRTDINKYFTPCIRNLWHCHGMVMVIGFDKSVMGIDSFTPVKSIHGSCPGGHLCDQRLHDFVCQLPAGADNSVYLCVCDFYALLWLVGRIII